MEYERLSKSHEYGLSKIYELVINNNPSIAYLLEGNSLVDQKLVMAHVYGHVDFFKNNFCFQMTSQGRDARDGGDVRKWIDTMANHGAVVRKWANRIGIENIEQYKKDLEEMKKLEAEAKKLEELQKKQEEEERKRLLDLEKKARDAAAAASGGGGDAGGGEEKK